MGGEYFLVNGVINGAGSQQDSFLQPHLSLYLQNFPFIYSFIVFCELGAMLHDGDRAVVSILTSKAPVGS